MMKGRNDWDMELLYDLSYYSVFHHLDSLCPAAITRKQKPRPTVGKDLVKNVLVFLHLVSGANKSNWIE